MHSLIQEDCFHIYLLLEKPLPFSISLSLFVQLPYRVNNPCWKVSDIFNFYIDFKFHFQFKFLTFFYLIDTHKIHYIDQTEKGFRVFF